MDGGNGKKCIFAAQNFSTNQFSKKHYGKSLRNRFHYDARFV